MPEIIKSTYNTRVPCVCSIRTADMWYNGHIIGTISEEANDAGETDWVIKVFRDEWEKSGKPRVAGIDMTLRLDEYVRSYVPAFVEERTLPDTRDHLQETLAELGMTWNDRFEFMCRTHRRCGCSKITVERQKE